MSALGRVGFRLHRWLAWLVGLQVLVWVVSGVLFAWLPFEPWVKAGDQLQRPVVEVTRLPPELADLDAARVRGLALVATPVGTAWRVQIAGVPQAIYRRLDGLPWVEPDAQAVHRFARTLIAGDAKIAAVDRLASVPVRLGLVAETGGRGDLWRIAFDDALGTRVYLDGRGGDLVAVRNEAWVWYDFFWRLHIMDYRGGEDFNNLLLRTVAPVALGLAMTGTLLAVLAARRRWRARRR